MKTLRDLDYSVLQQCMHCGLCLPTCPTYDETKHERHSPRGRIALMRSIADNELTATRTFGEEMYYCLGCLACTTACPAGVDYAKLFETARAHVEREGLVAKPSRSAVRAFTLGWLFMSPGVLRLVGRALRLWQRSGAIRRTLVKLLPARLRELESQAPQIAPEFSAAVIAQVETPRSPNGRRVAVLTGCVQDLVYASINRATVDVLLANGYEVHTPHSQGCCGSLHAHNGDLAHAQELARRLIETIDPEKFDAIVSNAGGCGSHLMTFGVLLGDDARYAAKARLWSEKHQDIHAFLSKNGFRKPAAAPHSSTTRVTYHESCHLCHGQKVSAQPREIMRAIPGVELVECAESSWCCGSAGIYTLTHPETAARLQDRKIGHLRATGAAIVATANPGCQLQIENGLAQAGADAVRVMHPVELLAAAYRAEER